MMKRRQFVKGRLRNNRGFTLIEIIAVLIIIAIISAVAISRGTGTDEANLRAEVDTLKGHLRYAQYLAMNENEGNVATTGTIRWGIRVDSSSYTLIKEAAQSNHSLSLPGESSATHSFSPINATVTGTVLFDEWGSPGTADINITLGGQPIEIKAGTGFIP